MSANVVVTLPKLKLCIIMMTCETHYLLTFSLLLNSLMHSSIKCNVTFPKFPQTWGVKQSCPCI